MTGRVYCCTDIGTDFKDSRVEFLDYMRTICTTSIPGKPGYSVLIIITIHTQPSQFADTKAARSTGGFAEIANEPIRGKRTANPNPTAS